MGKVKIYFSLFINKELIFYFMKKWVKLYIVRGDNIMKVEFVGTGSVFASFNSASYLINDKILVDIPNLL